MAFDFGSKSPRAEPDINVTPLIDIVLVLLIIFMVLTPMMQRGYDMNIPEKSKDPNQTPDPDQIVLTLSADGKVLLNRSETTTEELTGRLTDLMRGRTEAMKIVFFNADDDTVYQKCVEVMDSVRTAGGKVGLVTTELGSKD